LLFSFFFLGHVYTNWNFGFAIAPKIPPKSLGMDNRRTVLSAVDSFKRVEIDLRGVHSLLETRNRRETENVPNFGAALL
jgi:hypothetical protein